MWAGYSWAGAAWASQPEYGETVPGMIYCGDNPVFFAHGGDLVNEDIAFGGTLGQGSAYGGVKSGDVGTVDGGDAQTGVVYGGDERAG